MLFNVNCICGHEASQHSSFGGGNRVDGYMCTVLACECLDFSADMHDNEVIGGVNASQSAKEGNA